MASQIQTLDQRRAKHAYTAVETFLHGKVKPGKDGKPEPTPEAKKYGKYELVGTYYDETNERKAKDNAADVLTKLGDEPNLCMVGLWAYNPPAILSAVKDRGREGKIKIVGFDENPTTLEGIADGSIHGTVVQQPYLFGYEAVKLMARLNRGDRSALPADGLRYVPHRVITREGGKDRVPVATFRKELDEMLHGKGGQ